MRLGQYGAHEWQFIPTVILLWDDDICNRGSCAGDPAEKNRMSRMNHQHVLCFEHWSLVWDTDKAQNLHLLCAKGNYIFICQLAANFMVQVEL